MAYRIGVDVGGTFTDLVLAGRHGRLVLDKHPTTPHDQSEGVLGGIALLAAREGTGREALRAATDPVVHGTTTADNTMIEMSGATTGLVTSEGHRDEIEIRRGYKEDIWDPALPPPPPICPRRRRYGVPERLDFEGNVIVPLDEEAVRRACRRMQRQGVDSLAVVLLFSFVNPAHERRVRAIAAKELPGVMVSLSHEVMPSAPEFERTSTTLVNAYLGPKIGRYLSRLDERLRAAGCAGELLIMQSNGGVMPGGYVAEKAVAVMGSGPAGGGNGATAVAGQAGIRDFISVDMGGTSYDVCLVRGGVPDVKAGWNWHHRYLIGLPMVDVQSVGAGGGSIARVESGALRVGPESAGAEPGPVCYGRGGGEPTVTDANLVLGYLNPGSFCGGTMRLEVEGAHAAIRERVAKPLGISVVEAAEGIFRLVNANMAHAVRKVSAGPGGASPPPTRGVVGGDGPGPPGEHGGAARAPLLPDRVERSHRLHEELHTYACRDEEPILRGLRVKAVAEEEKPALPRLPRKAAGSPRLGARKAFFRGRFVATPVYDGARLAPGQAILGPAIVEEPFTTIVVYPGERATVAAVGHYTITRGRA